ncbi:hypothetical protein GCM10011611_25520 [Aliidongia dinghuensis]|uniref:Glycoside hydrolase n=1 Tax=Aliidongia dinghuensis TaxID=1867774 RepID=A0A8J3E3F6_9PROT|nr:hypothetical protein [Aliidongia dinghuensis]GGF18541.1 hypothetical protein GCM10011611_25520 [Aliidongia dinghuensis]
MGSTVFPRALFLAGLLLSWAAVSGACAAEPSAAPEIWVTATSQPIQIQSRWTGVRTDAVDQWRPDAAWPAVAAHARVAKLIAGNIENTHEADLKAVIDEVRRRHLALALEIGPLVRTPECGPPTESYGRAGETEAILQRIRGAGGELDYVAMDEPFFYGHVDPGGCRLSSAAIARQVATSIASMRRIFPNLKVGDIEVVGTDQARLAELVQWADDYRAATGERLAFLHADVAWSELAMRNLPPLAAGLRQRQVPFGIIYNADADVGSDVEWTRSAVDHVAEIETALGIHPDAAIFQTWTRYPTRVLPETQPGTLMGVPLQYLRPPSSLSLSRSGDGISGTLSGPDGAPMADAAIRLTAVDVAGRAWPTSRSLSGTVPEGAATAVVGIRVGVEGACDCAGPTAVILGGLHYREQGRPAQDVSPVTLPVADAPMSLRTLVVVPGRTQAPNLKQFPVTPGASFSFEAWIAAPEAAERSGYATVVFLDAQGKGLLRRNLWFEPAVGSLGSVATDARGRFHLAWPASAALSPEAEVRGVFDSDPSHRPAMAILPAVGAQAANQPPPVLERILPAGASPVTILGPHWTELAKLYGGGAPEPGVKAQWDQTTKRIQAMRLTGAAIMGMSDVALAALVRDLKARRIALGLEVLATNWWHEPACGGGIEGYVDPGSTNQIVAKLVKSGAVLDFIAMDEPFWFGHLYGGKNACRSAIADLANRVAVNVRIYIAAFPNLIVGDIEPFPAVSSQPNWRAEYAQWANAFAAATGSRLGFLDLDFDWYAPQLNTQPAPGRTDPAAIAGLARTAAAVARENGLEIGMIMNGGGRPTARSDADWIAQAREHIRALDASGVRFDRVLLETWDQYPAHTFSESDPADTLAGLVAEYVLARR